MKLQETIQIIGNRISIILLLLLLGFAPTYSKEWRIIGTVADAETKELLSEVKVIVKKQKVEIGEINTDKNGNFNIVVSSEPTDIDLFKLGYLKTHKKIRFIGDTLVMNISLVALRSVGNTLIVTADKIDSKLSEYNEHSHILEGQELMKEMGQTLASTLKNETGLAMRSMGPAPARPVIRGLSGNRVQINEDDNPIVDMSATSPDHAVATDPFMAEQLNVQRGAKVLLNSQTPFGGVINVVKNDIPIKHSKEINAMASYGYESANLGSSAGGMIDAPIGDFTFKTNGSYKNTYDLRTPIGMAKNTSSENYSANFGGAYFAEDYNIGASANKFYSNYGVPGGIVGSHPNGVNIELDKNSVNFKTDYHNHGTFIDDISFKLSRNYYFHTEYEKAGKIGAQFNIYNYNANLSITQHESDLFKNGEFGLNFRNNRIEYGGYVFVPNSTSNNISGFIFEEFNLDFFELQFSTRLNYSTIAPDRTEMQKIGYIRKRDFTSISTTVSATKEIIDNITFGFNLSQAMRPPAAEELFTEGPHLAAYSFETGNPELKQETGIGGEVFSYYKNEKYFLMATAYYYDYSNFITPRNTGNINVQTLLPIFSQFGIQAVILGFEAKAEYVFSDAFRLESGFSLTEGRNTTDEFWLPMIPPLKLNLEVYYTYKNLNIYSRVEYNSAQTKTDKFELPTDSYLIANLGMNLSTDYFGKYSTISITCDNLFNRIYRNHLSRIKQILPEPGRNIRLIYRLYI